MMGSVSSEGESRLVRQVRLEHSAEGLVRSLECIAAQHGDDAEVLAVCEKWTLRLSELESRVVRAAVNAQTPCL